MSQSLPNNKDAPLLDVENQEDDKLNNVEEIRTNHRSESWLSSYSNKSNIAKQIPSKVFQGKSAIGRANCCSRFLFSWAGPMLSTAHKELLQVEQFGNLRKKDLVQEDLPAFRRHYAKNLASGDANALRNAIFRTYRCQMLQQIAVGVIVACLTFGSPFLVLLLINFIEEPVPPNTSALDWVNMKKGVYISLGLVFSQLFAYMITEHLFYQQIMTGYRCTNLCTAVIYQKHALISSATNKDFTQGDVVNFVNVDAQTYVWMFVQLGDVMQVPFIFFVCFGFLFYYLGWSFMAGLGVFAVAFVINFGFGICKQRVQKRVMKAKDERMTETNQGLNNVKMLKLYAWQNFFENRIQEKRATEIKVLRVGGILSTCLIACLYLFPSLLPAVSFTTFIATGHWLDLATAVTTLIFFNLIAGPLIYIPMAISDFIELTVGMKRVQKFLQTEQVQTGTKLNTSLGSDALQIKGNFTWGFKEKQEKKDDAKDAKDKKKKDLKDKRDKVEEAEPQAPKALSDYVILKNLDITIKKGEFVVVIGDVGSGKSSLLNAIIGDMIYLPQNEIDVFGGLEKLATVEDYETFNKRLLSPDLQLNPVVRVDGTVAYVEQQAWIQNKTIRDNILFGKPLDRARYVNTIVACELERDLEILPAGDMTEIGEKGINLSGGQKARISLARAVYSNSSIVIMDDPISALDANVRKKIFTQVFQGMLNQKTRILVTHAVDFMHLADRIIVMSRGQVTAFGTYQELSENPTLKEVLLIHKRQQQENQNLTQSDELLQVPNYAVTNRITTTTNNSQLLDSSRPVSGLSGFGDSIIDMRDVSMRLDESIVDLKKSSENGEARNSELDDYAPGQAVKPISFMVDLPNPKQMDFEEDEVASDTQSVFGLLSKFTDLRKHYSNITKQAAKGTIIENEADEAVVVEAATYRKLIKYNGGPIMLIMVNVVMIGFMLSSIYMNLLLMEWANQPQDVQYARLEHYTLWIFGFAVCTAVCIFARVAILLFGSLRATRLLHDKIFAKVIRAPINLYFDVTPIGKILNRFSKDLQVLDNQLCFTIGSFFACFYQALAAMFVAAYAVPYIIVVVVIMMAVSYCVFKHVINGYKQCFRLGSVTKSPILSFLQETQSGSSVIRAFGKSDEFESKNFELINNSYVVNQVGTAVWSWYCVRMDLLSSVVMASGCAFCVVGREKLDPVLLALLLRYILTLQQYCVWTLYCYGSIEQQMVSVQRFLSLETVPQEASDHTEEVDAMWPTEGRVEFKNVFLRYRPGTEIVLDDLSFKVAPGTKVGVVGRTGAGKSTICLSLSRLVELEKGSIQIDGVDISKIDLQRVREKVTVIPQDPTLFEGTLRFNLDPFEIESDERIESLLLEAGLKDLLEKSAVNPEGESGLKMKITEGGKNLSSGEKQLICICRAILRKNRVVILDEATANIDVVTEQKIQKLIKNEFKNSTVITIAHRLNTIIQSDMVLVLSHGKVQEYAPPKELTANKDSEFSKLLKELRRKKEDL